MLKRKEVFRGHVQRNSRLVKKVTFDDTFAQQLIGLESLADKNDHYGCGVT